MKKLFLSDIKHSFTLGSGNAFPWQTGFRPAEHLGEYGLGDQLAIPQLSMYNFLGLGEGKQEDKDIEAKYQEWKKYFGAPSDCAQVQANIPRVRSLLNSKVTEAGGINTKTNTLAQLANATAFFTPWSISEGIKTNKAKDTQKNLQRDIGGLNKLLDEYVNFYNLNCIDETTGEKTITTDQVKQGTAELKEAVLPATATTDPLAQESSKVPLWVWIAGGVAAVGVILLAVKD